MPNSRLSCDFVREMEFMKLHVFRYSRRAGTAAARMPGQVSEEVKKERSARLLALSDEGAQRFHRTLCRARDERVVGADHRGVRTPDFTTPV